MNLFASRYEVVVQTHTLCTTQVDKNRQTERFTMAFGTSFITEL